MYNYTQLHKVITLSACCLLNSDVIAWCVITLMLRLTNIRIQNSIMSIRTSMSPKHCKLYKK